MCHVLIIEDEIFIALDLQALLASHGATSFAFAETEQDAIKAAHHKMPGFITSDVHLRIGTGPAAVQIIHREIGPIPVIFITATPEHCTACAPPALVFPKPLQEHIIANAFRELAVLDRE